MVLLGSPMESGRHANTNQPVELADDGFDHGQHPAFDRKNNAPLAILDVTMLHQRRLGCSAISHHQFTCIESSIDRANDRCDYSHRQNLSRLFHDECCGDAEPNHNTQKFETD